MIVSPHFRAQLTSGSNIQGRSAPFKADILSFALSIPPSEAILYNSSAL
jgi:hypothetical protein